MVRKYGRLIVVLLLLMLSAGLFGLSFRDERASRQLYGGLQDQVSATRTPTQPAAEPTPVQARAAVTPTRPATVRLSPGPTLLPTAVPTLSPEEEETGRIQVVLRALAADNPDIAGWIRIPGTNIDYPVVRGDDNRFYLDHDIRQASARNGSIFMDYRNEPELGQRHTILYGHHTRDHTMFTDLMGYKQQAFFKENARIEYYTLDSKTTWVIFAAYVTGVDFYYIQTIFADDAAYARLIEQIRSRSAFFRPVAVTPDDPILTLSTCTYEFKNARFAVHAVLEDAGKTPDAPGEHE
ncbi:MAG: class B sortase [Clostridiaceae bacterium]|nr:class B sortase [Clostridiaceae bacterium]